MLPENACRLFELDTSLAHQVHPPIQRRQSTTPWHPHPTPGFVENPFAEWEDGHDGALKTMEHDLNCLCSMSPEPDDSVIIEDEIISNFLKEFRNGGNYGTVLMHLLRRPNLVDGLPSGRSYAELLTALLKYRDCPPAVLHSDGMVPAQVLPTAAQMDARIPVLNPSLNPNCPTLPPSMGCGTSASQEISEIDAPGLSRNSVDAFSAVSLCRRDLTYKNKVGDLLGSRFAVTGRLLLPSHILVLSLLVLWRLFLLVALSLEALLRFTFLLIGLQGL